MSDLSDIVEQLRIQQTQLTEKKSRLAEELEAIESELASVLNALAALNAPTKTKQKKGKPSPKQDHVRDALRTSLSETQFADHEEFVADVGKRILAAGYSRSGLALRLKEVLSEPEFAHAIPYQATAAPS